MGTRIIQVQVIQAHTIRPPGGGGYKQYVVGDRIEIEESEFCANLHRKIKPPASSSTSLTCRTSTSAVKSPHLTSGSTEDGQ